MCVAAVAVAVAAPSFAEDGWTDPVPVMNRAQIAVSYRARIVGDHLLVEANHGPGWHTYAMDNTERARKASGQADPESEQPTRIQVSGGAKASGPWRQSQPKDMSQPDINWFTWGFEGVARFTVPIDRAQEGDIVVTIDAQSCNASSCTMARNVKIVVPNHPAGAGADTGLPEDLIAVEPNSQANGPPTP